MINRVTLEKQAKEEIGKFATNNKISSEFIEILAQAQIPKGVATGILIGAYNLNKLDDVAFGYVFKTIAKLSNNAKFTKLLADFSNFDIDSIDKFVFEQNTKVENILVFNDVVQYSEDHYVCPKKPWLEIVTSFNQGLINYNIRTQRQLTYFYNKQTKEYRKQITIDNNSVNEIKEKMLNDSFIPNTISLNIRSITGDERFQYYEDTKILQILVDADTNVDIIDGMHRMMGAMESIGEKPQFGLSTILNIFHYTEDRALEYINQENKRNEIAVEHIKSFNNNSIGLLIAKELKKKGNATTNVLYGNVADNINELFIDDSYVTQNTLGDAIDDWFDFKSIKTLQATRYLTSVINAFVDHYSYYFNDTPASYVKNNMFYGIVAMAEKIYTNYQDSWEDVISDIFGTHNIDEFISLSDTRKTLSKSQIVSIANDFRDIVIIREKKGSDGVNG